MYIYIYTDHVIGRLLDLFFRVSVFFKLSKDRIGAQEMAQHFGLMGQHFGIAWDVLGLIGDIPDFDNFVGMIFGDGTNRKVIFKMLLLPKNSTSTAPSIDANKNIWRKCGIFRSSTNATRMRQ